MSSICMFVRNSFEYDPRVEREAKALVERGYTVTVIALRVAGVTPRRETTAYGADVVRVRQLDFGVTRLNRWLAERAVAREQVLAAKEGRSPDVSGAVRRSILPVSTTSTPGASPLRGEQLRAEATGSTEPSRGSRMARRAFAVGTAVAGPATRALRDAYASRRMVRVGLSLRPAVCHAHDLNTLRLASVCARRIESKLVYDSHEMHSARAGVRAVQRRWAILVERSLVPRADAVLTVSPSIARYLRSLPGCAGVTVIRNVPEPPKPGPALDLRSALRIPSTERIIVYAGTVQRHRGIEEVMAALGFLDRCTLVVIGHGDHRAALDDEVVRAGLGARVRFLGPVPHDEMVRWCAGADVGVACIKNVSMSYYYALPNKVFEYLTAGLPLVASDFPDMAEVVRGYDVGTVCDPTNPRSIASAIGAVLDDPAANARFRRNAKRAAEECNWSVEKQLLVDVYGRLEASRMPHDADDVERREP